MRLLHTYTLPELIAAEPADFKDYADPSGAKKLYNLRKNAAEKFALYFALNETEKPLSAATKSGRSPLGR